jgi:hypothetical protein
MAILALTALFWPAAWAGAGTASVATGTESSDFNGDGRSDLAVGVPDEDVGTTADAGAVNVIYGTSTGLAAWGNQIWYQGKVQGVAQELDWFGYSVAAGDFNGDGFADLAIGVPDEAVGTSLLAGAVNVLYGSSFGLTASGNQVWYQGKVLGTAQFRDHFGFSLAAGDFNGDRRADLAVGVPEDDLSTRLGTAHAAGAVNVIYGSSRGLTATGNQHWYQGKVQGAPEESDQFGYAVGAGDLNGEGHADLAVGVWLEDVGTSVDAGAVNVIYGSSTGLVGSGNQIWYQGKVQGAAESDDLFGSAVAIGDFNGSGREDLAVGASSEDVGTSLDAGAVNVIYGTSTGLAASGNQIWYQGKVQGTAGFKDYFGVALAAGDFKGSGQDALALGVFGDDVGSIDGAGTVNVIYGSFFRLTTFGNQLWYQGKISGPAEAGDLFGLSVAAGRR